MLFLGASPQTPGLKGAIQNGVDCNEYDSKGVNYKMLFHNISKLCLDLEAGSTQHAPSRVGRRGKKDDWRGAAMAEENDWR